MLVKEYDNSKSFLDAYEAVLLDREAVSQFILLPAYQSRKTDMEGLVKYGAVLDEDKVSLLFCIQQSRDLIIYAAMTENISQASVTLADYLGNSHIAINGINARNDICTSFIEQYKKHTDCSFTEIIGLDIMEIRKVTDIKPVEGTQRLAFPEEVRFITDWMIDFQIEALASEMDYEAVLKRAESLINEKKIFLYENSKNQAVSMAVAERRLAHGMALTYIFTPEEYRGEGYAAANVYYLSKELLEQGYEFCTLLVDKKNPLSARAYEKVGYVILEDINEYKIITTADAG